MYTTILYLVKYNLLGQGTEFYAQLQKAGIFKHYKLLFLELLLQSNLCIKTAQGKLLKMV